MPGDGDGDGDVRGGCGSVLCVVFTAESARVRVRCAGWFSNVNVVLFTYLFTFHFQISTTFESSIA